MKSVALAMTKKAIAINTEQKIHRI